MVVLVVCIKNIKIYQSYIRGIYVYFEYIQVVFHIYTKHIKAILHMYPRFFIPTQINILVLLLLYWITITSMMIITIIIVSITSR
jgi:hypothetical protein